MSNLIVLLAVENQIYREGLISLITHDRDLHATVVPCDPSDALDVLKQARTRAPHAVILDRDDNALPGPCTNLLNQFPNLGVIVISRNRRSPPLYYRQTMCVEELDSSGTAILTALRGLQKSTPESRIEVEDDS